MVLLAEVLVLLANLAVLGLNLKLYTEYFKDQSQRACQWNGPSSASPAGATEKERDNGNA